MDVLRMFLQEDEGATAVEYAMIIGLIALATFLVFRAMGWRVFDIIDIMQFKLKEANQTYTPTQ
jgi:Flp pilus assembly pilin Flp